MERQRKGNPEEVTLAVLAVKRGVSLSEPLGISYRPEGGKICPGGRALERVWLFRGFRLFISRDREVVNSPGSHPGDRWFESNSRNQDFLRKEGASRLVLLSPAWPPLWPEWIQVAG